MSVDIAMSALSSAIHNTESASQGVLQLAPLISRS
jgi:hypothetical protein